VLQQVEHDAVCGGGQGMYRNRIAFVEPKINRGFNLRQGSLKLSNSKLCHSDGLAMPVVILNLALLFVLQFAALQFFFRHRQNLLHRVAEFIGWSLDLVGGCRHGTQYAQMLRLSKSTQ
jgi:hypothetical protein